MHRSLDITVPSHLTEMLAQQLTALDDVIGLTVHVGASRKPPGDVLTVHVLNRGADDVLRLARAVAQPHELSIATAELGSLISPPDSQRIVQDYDEAIWEEMETGLRHQGQITPNYLALMALGGAVASIGLVAEPVSQAIALIASAIIAPGFEPIVKLPLGIALQHWPVVWKGLRSIVAGYAVLILSAAVTTAILVAADSVSPNDYPTNGLVQSIVHPQLPDILLSFCGAAAGILMVAAYRRSVIAGPLIVLVMIQAAALAGAAVAIRMPLLALQALERLGLDILIISSLGIVILWLKQHFLHKRKPL